MVDEVPQGLEQVPILVVEDDPDLRLVLEKILNKKGYRCLSFESGEEALEQCDLDSIHAAVLDVQLPGMDGVAVGQSIKERAGDENFVPVVLIGGHDVVEERVRGIRAGCDDFLGKPVNFFELEVRLESLLARRRAHENVVRANHKLRSAQDRKRELAALVVHDLRNPLSALLGNVHLLREDVQGEPSLLRTIGNLEELTLKALSMVAGLLDVEELEEGLLEAQTREVDLRCFADRFPIFYRTAIEMRRLTMNFEVQEGLVARFDEELLFRCFENLLDNAVRYAHRSGSVVFRAASDGDDLVVTVGNDGPPVPDAERSRIFGRYYRLEARRQGARANRGLGLYFCKLACDAHGGSITLESEDDYPACFVVRIPGAVVR